MEMSISTESLAQTEEESIDIDNSNLKLMTRTGKIMGATLINF